MLSSTWRACLSTVTSRILPVRRSIGVRPGNEDETAGADHRVERDAFLLQVLLTPGTSMTSFLIFFIARRTSLNGAALARDGKGKHEQYARLLRHQVVADDEAVGVLLRRDDHAAVPRARGEHHRDAGFRCALSGLEERRGERAAAEADEHDAGRPALDEGVDQDAISAGIGVDDVDRGRSCGRARRTVSSSCALASRCGRKARARRSRRSRARRSRGSRRCRRETRSTWSRRARSGFRC